MGKLGSVGHRATNFLIINIFFLAVRGRCDSILKECGGERKRAEKRNLLKSAAGKLICPRSQSELIRHPKNLPSWIRGHDIPEKTLVVARGGVRVHNQIERSYRSKKGGGGERSKCVWRPETAVFPVFCRSASEATNLFWSRFMACAASYVLRPEGKMVFGANAAQTKKYLGELSSIPSRIHQWLSNFKLMFSRKKW